MEMYIKVNGKMTKLMGKEFIDIGMDLLMLDNGMKIYNMGLVFKNGQMDHHTKGKLYLN